MQPKSNSEKRARFAGNVRSGSPFRGKFSPFVPSSNPGISFARPTSPMAKSASHRGDLTTSGLKDAHISTAGVVSGLITTSHVIAAPVPSYGFIHGGEHDDEHTFSSNKSSSSKLQPAQFPERIHKDVETETANKGETLLDARRTNEDEADFSPPNEIKYMRRVKWVKINEFPRELSDSCPADRSSIFTSHEPTWHGAAEEVSLDGMFRNMNTFLNVETFTDLVQKWSPARGKSGFNALKHRRFARAWNVFLELYRPVYSNIKLDSACQPPSLPIFCIGSMDYTQLLLTGRQYRGPVIFTDLEDTGIPQLCRHIQFWFQESDHRYQCSRAQVNFTMGINRELLSLQHTVDEICKTSGAKIDHNMNKLEQALRIEVEKAAERSLNTIKTLGEYHQWQLPYPYTRRG
ncbi:hypothetical protein BDR05DRAFT_1005988 [Suillus weaverae]|nr:hypothetical protein BDR05DRAFT_1005988 [Suillus weaverae]